MTQLFDESLYVQGNERFILDDQYRCADLRRNLPSGAVNEFKRLMFRTFKSLPDLLRIEGLQCVQQESDPRFDSDGREVSR